MSVFADTTYRSYWLDDPKAPAARPPLLKDVRCDLAVVGAGFTGLWSALLAAERFPGREIVIVEQRSAGWAASGRNGGFLEASLTHGIANGAARFPGELPRLEALGLENLQEIAETVEKEGIDCQLERNGTISVATAEWQIAELEEIAGLSRRYGHEVELLDADALAGLVRSPTYLAGLLAKGHTALVNPARLAWGLAEACERRGVRLFEQTKVVSVSRSGSGLRLETPHGAIQADKAVLATNAFRPLVRRVRPYILPVYDYVLVTEPLSADQKDAIGWRGRQGLSDSGNQFHYYRLTADDRILFGGYDAVYHYANGLRDELDRRPATFDKLADHLVETFPVLDGIGFTHAWGGAIDTCSRFFAFYGTAFAKRAAYAAGFTGLGVGATRFAAKVMLELLEGGGELSELEMVRSKPVPFPPEPLRYGVVELTRRSLASADTAGGQRNAWLRLLDRIGLGFDS